MNHIGERFGRLVIVGTVHNERRNRTHYICKCDCGNTVEQQYSRLKNGKVKSCGCMLNETRKQRHEEMLKKQEESRRKADQYFLNQRAIAYIKAFKKEYREDKRREYRELIRDNKRLYYVWQNMMQRCTNVNHIKYCNYGGRGIRVCSKWHSFKSFHKWSMDNGYTDGLTIDRIDTNGNYEPSNCRWTDNVTQQNNRRNNCWLERDGEIHTLAEWARILNLSYDWFYESWEHKGFKKVEYEKKS